MEVDGIKVEKDEQVETIEILAVSGANKKHCLVEEEYELQEKNNEKEETIEIPAVPYAIKTTTVDGGVEYELRKPYEPPYWPNPPYELPDQHLHKTYIYKPRKKHSHKPPDKHPRKPPDKHPHKPPDIHPHKPPDIHPLTPPDIHPHKPPDVHPLTPPDKHPHKPPDIHPLTPPDKHARKPPDKHPFKPPDKHAHKPPNILPYKQSADKAVSQTCEHADNVYSCNKCGYKLFVVECSREEDMLEVGGYVCRHCDKRFMYKLLLDKHVKTHYEWKT